VESGAVGELTGMRIMLMTQREEYLAHENHWIHRLPGGIIGETGPHVVYLSLAFLKNVKKVDVLASKKSDYPWVLYDDYRIELEAENITSSIYVSHANSYTHEEVELFGTNCALKVDMQSMLLLRSKCEHLKPSSVALSSLSTASQTIRGVASNALRVVARRPMLGHDIMVERFVASILNDQPVPVSAEEGRETVRVLNIIVQKLENK
jgi:predicted dehydrogenase